MGQLRQDTVKTLSRHCEGDSTRFNNILVVFLYDRMRFRTRFPSRNQLLVSECVQNLQRLKDFVAISTFPNFGLNLVASFSYVGNRHNTALAWRYQN